MPSSLLRAGAAALMLAVAAGAFANPPQAAKPRKAAASRPAPPPVEIPPVPATERQLVLAQSVLTGAAACEFAQTVHVSAAQDHPGWFEVRHGRQRFLMAAQETSTGAVRLEDPRSGMVWLQIPAKSMLMDSRQGRRIVDACQLEDQRLAAAAPLATELGIAPAEPATADTATGQ